MTDPLNPIDLEAEESSKQKAADEERRLVNLGKSSAIQSLSLAAHVLFPASDDQYSGVYDGLLGKGSPDAVRMTAMFNGALVNQWAIAHRGKILILTCPFVAKDDAALTGNSKIPI